MRRCKKRDAVRMLKKIASILMTTALLVTSMNFSGWEVQAAKVKVKKLKVTAESKTLYVGKYSPYTKTKLKAAVSPAKANQKVTFKSKTPKVAKVSNKGVVTAKKVGKATITVTTKGTNAKGKKITKSVKITVKKYIAPTSLNASISATKLKVGKTAKITASLGGNPTCKQLIYTSSKPGVATVSSNGMVTAKAAGQAVITVKSQVKGIKGKVLMKSFYVKVEGGTSAVTKPAETTKKTDETTKEIQTTAKEESTSRNPESSTGENESTSRNEESSTGESESTSRNEESSTGESESTSRNEESSTGESESTSRNEESSTGESESTSRNEESSTGESESTSRNEESSTEESESTSKTPQESTDESSDESTDAEEPTTQEETTKEPEAETAVAQITPVSIDNLDYLEDAQKTVDLTNPALNTNNTIDVSGATDGMTIQSTMTINALNSNANTYLWNYSGAGNWPVAYQFVTTDGKLYTNFDLRAEFITEENFLPIGEEFTITTSVTKTQIRIYIDGELKAYYDASTGFSMGGTFSIINASLVTDNTTAYGDVVKASWTRLVLGKSPACVTWDQPATMNGTVASFAVYDSALQPEPSVEGEQLVFPEELSYQITPDSDEVELGAVVLNAMAGGTLTYISMDSSIASFTQDGKLKMNKAGQVVVKAVTSSGVQASSRITITYSTVGIHDPSVFQDPKSGYYYTVGSHCLIAYSKDMKSWAYVSNSQSGYSESNHLFSKVYTEEFAEVYEFVKPGVEAPEGVWAPSIIYSEVTDKYYMYVTLADGTAQGKCAIVLTESDQPEGPYTYKEMIVASAITTSDVEKTNLMSVLGIDEVSAVPAKYTSNDRTYPDCIDATVFYDHSGKLWMVYGSFTCAGGIRMIQLDPSTGGRLTSATYEDTGTDEALGDKDPYYGIKLANNNGEGPFIVEVPSEKSSTGYYYFLWTSVGGLQSYGGYHMRMYRSENVEGPYVDTAGNLATSTLGRANLGLRVMDNYKFTFMDYAFTSCGGNSALLANVAGKAEAGKLFLHYHQKWANGSEGFVSKSNQMFLNEDGWLVTAPFAYDGETMDKTYTAEDVAGEYEFVLHRTTYTKTGTTNYDYSDAVAVTLKEDGTVSGYYTGTWSLTDHYITITVGGKTYKGVVLEQNIENADKTKTMVFTAVGDGNIQSVWGMKMIEDAEYYADLDAEKIAVPTITSLSDLNLVTKSRRYDFDIAWKSSNEDVISFNGGVGTVAMVDEDTEVTLTATLSKGTFHKDYTRTITVKATEYYAGLDKEQIEVSTDDITTNFTLPTSSTDYGFAISWKSSNTDLISFDGGNATVNPGDSAAEVTLTATFKKGSFSKDYTWPVTVAAFRIPLSTIVDSDTIELPTTYLGKTVSWSSSNDSIINAQTGAVARLENEDQTVTLTATVDGRPIVYNMVVKRSVAVYSQDYQDVINGTDVFASTSLSGGISIVTDEDNKYLQFKQDSSSGNRGGMGDFDTAVNTLENYIVELDLAIKSGNKADRSVSQFVLTGTDTTTTKGNNNGTDAGYILKLSTGPSSTTWAINDSDKTVVIPADTWVHIRAAVSVSTGTVQLQITNGTTELYSGEVKVNGNGYLKGMYILSGREGGLTKVDNITVH